jgi:hypothetical protein
MSHRGEADQRQVLARNLQSFLFRDIANPEAESNVVLDSHPGKDGVLLEDDTAISARPGHRPAHYSHLAALRAE